MADRMREALGKLLDRHQEQRIAELAREQKVKDDDARFLTRFQEIRRSVIRPVLEAAAALLEERGHRCSIIEQEFVFGTAGRIGEASIALRLLPLGVKTLHEDRSSLAISTRLYNKTVWIDAGDPTSTGAGSGPKGAYPLDDITPQLIEDQLLAFVGRVLV